MIRKTIIFLAVLVLLAAAAGCAAVQYVKPTETLDLDYEPVSLQQKVMEMVQNRKLEVRLTEADLNSILKKQLAEHPLPDGDVVIEGVRFEQRGDQVVAFVNLKTVGGVRVGAELDFSLQWKPPELIVRHGATRIRQYTVPKEWLQLDPIVVRTDEGLPPLVGIKDIRFEESGIVVSLTARF